MLKETTKIELSRKQRRHLALMLKSRWNDLVTQIQMGDLDESEAKSEFEILEGLLQKLDANDEFVYGLD